MICKRCENDLPVESFSEAHNPDKTRTWRIHTCKTCMAEYHREWQARKRVNSPEKTKAAQKAAYERKKAKMQTDPEYRARYLDKARKWQEAHREELKEGRKIIPDDDPETDLVPYQGDAAWARITR